jgi:hypothetical protein
MSNLAITTGNQVSTTVANLNLAARVESALIEGDLRTMSAEEKLVHYKNVCESLGLNPHTKPFGYIELKQKLTLYALRNCTDQLRSIHGVSVISSSTSVQNGICTVTCTVRDRAGREDSDIGCVPVAGLSGEALANAHMKAVTKAKRRATLSLCGLGWLDETEVETIRDAKTIQPAELHKPKLADESKTQDSDKKLVTKEQLKLIASTLREIHFSPLELENWKTHMREEYGVEKSADLTFEAAELLIADLQALTNPQTTN